MKTNYYPYLKESFIFLIISIFLLSSGCQSKKEHEAVTTEKPDMLVGEWKAEWQTHIEENMHSMNGELRFEENGKVAVMAYGYEGCYFMSDTSKNEMAWKISGDTLHLQVPEDNFSFAYQIKDLKSNDIHLTLLEDINLHLTKNN